MMKSKTNPQSPQLKFDFKEIPKYESKLIDIKVISINKIQNEKVINGILQRERPTFNDSIRKI